MSDKPLAEKKIAILVADGFEQVELNQTAPKRSTRPVRIPAFSL